MAEPGSRSNPLRVAIVGSGPAGFYVVGSFGKHPDVHAEIDMFDRLPTPFGLVRGGVAPDHQKIKSVARAFDVSARRPHFRFYGHVEFGTHLALADLKKHYHQIVFATGAQVDRRLDIPGEHLNGSYSATDFVAWYNGHPDYAGLVFDLDHTDAAIVGMGNVAVDVARMLCRTEEELKRTDMPDYAIDAIASSKIRNIYMLGRRGAAQAAFTPPELKELSELFDADVIVPPGEAVIDEQSRKEMETSGDRNVVKNVAILSELGRRKVTGRRKLLTIRFLVSPTELVDDGVGNVRAIRLVKNELYRSPDGSIRPRGTGKTEELPVGVVFRSVGYRGVALGEVPFNEKGGTLYNQQGRVTDHQGHVLAGLYCAGWIKRGPSGVIGTNKVDANETAVCMLEDLRAGRLLTPEFPDVNSAAALVRRRQPDVVSYEDWCSIDQEEVKRGAACDRPRIKFTRIEEMLSLLDK